MYLNHNQYLPERILVPFLGLKRPIVGVEIGVACGNGSVTMLNQLPNLKLYCVDPWEHFEGRGYEAEKSQEHHDEFYEHTKRRLKEFGKRAVLLKMTSDEAMKHVEEKIQFVYIDGDHRYTQVKTDIKNWKTKLKPISILGGHDWQNDEVKRAVLEEFDLSELKFGDDFIWYHIYGRKT